MKIIYDASDIERILREHHRYTRDPIKIGYTHYDVRGVEIQSLDGQYVVIAKVSDEEEKEEEK